jgi:RNA polymerase sigma factor (sigma-70 family)
MGRKKLSAEDESSKSKQEKADAAGMLGAGGATRRGKKKQTKLTPEEIELIVTEHQTHGSRLAWSFLKGWQVRLHPDEVTSIVGMALVEAATRFDPSRGVAFKTFFFYHLRGMLLREITRLVSQSKIRDFIPSAEAVVGKGEQVAQAETLYPYLGVDSRTPEKIVQDNQVAAITKEAIDQLDELERQVVQRHYINDEPLKDIAKDMGYNRCHISRVKSKALAKLHLFISDTFPTEAISDEISDDEPTRKVSANVKRGYTGGRGRRKRSTAVKPRSSKKGSSGSRE